MVENASHRLVYFVSGMWCSTCSKSVKEVTQKVTGVSSVNLSYASKLLLVEVKDLTEIDEIDKSIQRDIQNIGFGVRRQAPGWVQNYRSVLEEETNTKLSWVLLSVIWFLAMWSSMLAFAGYLGGIEGSDLYYLTLASSLFGIPAIVLGVLPYARAGIKTLRFSRIITLDFFISIGGISAILVSIFYLVNGNAISYADSGSMIIAILLLTKKIENTIVQKVTSSILFQLNPSLDKVLVERKQTWVEASTDKIRRGDRVRLYAGSTIPFDGKLLNEACEVNNHMLTGEAYAVDVKQGDHLFAGAIANTDIELEVLNPQGSRRIDAWAEVALLGKAKDSWYSQFFLKLERSLVYLALLGAVFIAASQLWQGKPYSVAIESFFVGILIFCPCLFASIIPLSRQMAHLALLRIGILLNRSDALLEMTDIKDIYLDKTGTLEAVESHFELFEKVPSVERNLSDLAMQCSHPILRGLKSLPPTESIRSFKEVPGKGVASVLQDGKSLLVGRPSFIKSQGVSLNQNYGVIFPLVAYDGNIVGQIVTKKVYDKRSKGFLKKLKQQYPKLKIQVLSGDPKPLEEGSFLRKLSQLSYEGNLSPETKADRISEASLYVGDGLNDTLAMAKAKVSVLLGNRILGFAPVDFQIEFPNINLVFALLSYSKTFKRVLIQTLAAAFLYNIIAITLAANGHFSPLGAVLAMLFSFSVLLLSSIRLLKSPSVPA